jgi:hypothetical protein
MLKSFMQTLQIQPAKAGGKNLNSRSASVHL